jgi:2-polyprenyl-3-methyl-5-hydroxy-6-metoxy-1,4-benzoquinol methylase
MSSSASFKHTMDLPGIGVVEGQWDLRGRLSDYIAGVPVKNKRALDIGTASGFLSFELERAGAEVVSFDADIAERIAMLPFQNSLYSTNRGEWLRNTNSYLDSLKNSYWLAHRLYGSSNRVFYGDVYDLPDAIGTFDVVVVGQILVHLRDPITALASIARRCAGTMVIVEGMIDSEDRFAKFFARAETGPEWIWWQYSTGMYCELMKIMGFEVLKIVEGQYLCKHEYTKGQVALKSLVARRR